MLSCGHTSRLAQIHAALHLRGASDLGKVLSVSAFWGAAKSGDLHVSVTPEVTGQARHRGSRGIPLVPQVTVNHSILAFMGLHSEITSVAQPIEGLLCAELLKVLYQHPENKPITPDAAHFCFPHGVQPMLLERTPSMSALNELVYSQQYQHSDANSFIFVLKVGLFGPAGSR